MSMISYYLDGFRLKQLQAFAGKSRINEAECGGILWKNIENEGKFPGLIYSLLVDSNIIEICNVSNSWRLRS